MKKLLIPFVVLCTIVFMGSCTGSKEVAYFQNIDSLSLAASKGLFDARIMPKDLLTITVGGVSDPKAVSHFNLSVSNTLNPTGNLSSGACRPISSTTTAASTSRASAVCMWLVLPRASAKDSSTTR